MSIEYFTFQPWLQVARNASRVVKYSHLQVIQVVETSHFYFVKWLSVSGLHGHRIPQDA